MLCRLAIVVLILAAGAAAPRSQTERHADVLVVLPADQDFFARLASLGVRLDHAVPTKVGGQAGLRTVLSESELAAVRVAGAEVQVLDADLSASFALRRSLDCPSTQYAITGSMGCYPTFDETIAILDDMAAQFPGLISARQSIGTTSEGRDVWMVEISDQPGTGSGDPEVLYTALHHAREPQGMATVLHFMWYLLDHYDESDAIQDLIDGRRLFFVPVLNPDGYVYNEITDPNGGGYWRKNRRPIGGNVFGVDLNRNYGFEWGYDDEGSSPSASSSTYRGPAAFSEPETAAIRDFMESGRSIKVAMNYHSYSNLLIYPWGFEEDYYTPDSAAFVDLSRVMVRNNGYLAGTGNQTVQYVTNGDSDDWMYGEQATKPVAFSWTPEVGSAEDGFWPSPSRIEEIAVENLSMNIDAAVAAGGFPALAGFTVDEPANGFPDPGETASMSVTMRNIGLGSLSSVGAALRSDNPLIVVNQGSLPSVSLDSQGEAVIGPFTFHIDASHGLGNAAGLSLEVDADGRRHAFAIEPFRVGTEQVVFADDAANTDFWGSSQGWGVGSPFVSPPAAFSDSPAGLYASGADARLTLNQPLDFTMAIVPTLSFEATWDIESSYDIVTVEASANGNTWVALSGQHTSPAAATSEAPEGTPGYDGTSGWVTEQMDLSAYAGEPSVRLRFRLRSDGSVIRDGFHVDDVRVTNLVNGGSVATQSGVNEASAWLGVPKPNPVSRATSVSFRAEPGDAVELAVFDALGRRITVLHSGWVGTGEQTVTWTPEAALAPGVYVVRLQSGTSVQSRRMLVTR